MPERFWQAWQVLLWLLFASLLKLTASLEGVNEGAFLKHANRPQISQFAACGVLNSTAKVYRPFVKGGLCSMMGPTIAFF